MIPGLWAYHDGSGDAAIVAMADAARMQSTRPRAALDRFRDLAGEAGFPYRQFAREQCAVILWRLGCRDEALLTLRIHGQPIGEAGEPGPDYARARAIVCMAQAAVETGGHEVGSGERLAQQLEYAGRIFERNGDLIMDARVHRLKARLVQITGDLHRARRTLATTIVSSPTIGGLMTRPVQASSEPSRRSCRASQGGFAVACGYEKHGPMSSPEEATMAAPYTLKKLTDI